MSALKPTRVRREELWEPWWVGEEPWPNARMETWNVPADLVARFIFAKGQMEDVWEELRRFDPDCE